MSPRFADINYKQVRRTERLGRALFIRRDRSVGELRMSRFQLRPVLIGCSLWLAGTGAVMAESPPAEEALPALKSPSQTSEPAAAETTPPAAGADESTPPAALPVAPATLSPERSRTELLAALPSGVSLHYINELATLYALNNMQLIWQDHQAELRFQRQLAEMAASGIHPRFGQWANWLATPTLKGKARDAVLSDAMLGYLRFVGGVQERGKRWLYEAGSFSLSSSPSQEMVMRWLEAYRTGDMEHFVRGLAPQHPDYAPMRKAFIALAEDNAPWPVLRAQLKLRPGEASSAVPTIRAILQRLSQNRALRTLLNGAEPGGAGQSYDATMVKAVKAFQRAHGLAADGVIGGQTLRWLTMSPPQRAALLALNMQRLRIIPAEFSTAILVNIPDFTMNYYLDGKVKLTSRVIVGRPDRKTPVMNSNLNNVVINPPWNVPPTLSRKDLLPKIKNNPGYLAQHNYILLGRGSQPIDPYQVNWSEITENNFPYRLRQAPGSSNALGRYKFNMPNNDAIYLHDTPNHSLFAKQTRALSSGCVRVNKAAVLADILLKDVGWSEERLKAALKKDKSTYVNIPRHIPVSLFYLTAWSDSSDKMHFRSDIYDYDAMAQKGVSYLAPAMQLITKAN